MTVVSRPEPEWLRSDSILKGTSLIPKTGTSSTRDEYLQMGLVSSRMLPRSNSLTAPGHPLPREGDGISAVA